MVTVNPNYVMKGRRNPYYDMKSPTLVKIVKRLKEVGIDVKTSDIGFKCVDKAEGETIFSTKGKSKFQIEIKKTKVNFNIQVGKKEVEGHTGMKTRKNATASSDVNEILSVYYLENVIDTVESLETLASKGGKSQTGVYTGDDKGVTFDKLKQLLDEDETAERDILIGQQNAIAIKKDINGKKIRTLYWTPKIKPSNISKKNPSDVIIEFTDRTFQGYSNKISTGEDVTPKFNTNITAYYSKNEDRNQLANIKTLIDSSWNESVPIVNGTNAKAALAGFDITKEAFSETKSQEAFVKLSESFREDGLDFYGRDFYYLFRNRLITKFAKYLEDKDNLIYFLQTIYFYTYDDPKSASTPCPYKLLIGDVKGSILKEVSSDERLKQVLINTNKDKFSSIQNTYNGTSQSFNITFDFDPGTNGKYKVEIPTTVRTRAVGGWSGKSLYINTPGVKIDG